MGSDIPKLFDYETRVNYSNYISSISNNGTIWEMYPSLNSSHIFFTVKGNNFNSVFNGIESIRLCDLTQNYFLKISLSAKNLNSSQTKLKELGYFNGASNFLYQKEITNNDQLISELNQLKEKFN